MAVKGVHFIPWPIKNYAHTFSVGESPRNQAESNELHPSLSTIKFTIVYLNDILVILKSAVDYIAQVKGVM